MVNVEMTTHDGFIAFNGKLIKETEDNLYVLNNFHWGDAPFGVDPRDHGYLYCWRIIKSQYEHKVIKIDWTEDDENKEKLLLMDIKDAPRKQRTFDDWDAILF